MRFSVQTTILFVFALLFLSCSGKNRGAKEYLSEARIAYEEGNYALAKLKIDSIKLVFPKAFDEINAGFSLMQEEMCIRDSFSPIFSATRSANSIPLPTATISRSVEGR